MSKEEITRRQALIAGDYSGPVFPTVGLVTSRLIYVLQAGEPGDVIEDTSWPEDLGGVAPGDKSYMFLLSAFRYLLHNESITWKRVRDAGCVKCLEHTERVTYAQGQLASSRKKAKRTIQISNSTDRNALTEEERQRLTATTIQAALAVTATAPKMTKRLKEHDKPTQPLLAEWCKGKHRD